MIQRNEGKESSGKKKKKRLKYRDCVSTRISDFFFPIGITFYSFSLRLLKDLLQNSIISIIERRKQLHLDLQIACFFLFPFWVYEKMRHWVLVVRMGNDGAESSRYIGFLSPFHAVSVSVYPVLIFYSLWWWLSTTLVICFLYYGFQFSTSMKDLVVILLPLA